MPLVKSPSLWSFIKPHSSFRMNTVTPIRNPRSLISQVRLQGCFKSRFHMYTCSHPLMFSSVTRLGQRVRWEEAGPLARERETLGEERREDQGKTGWFKGRSWGGRGSVRGRLRKPPHPRMSSSSAASS